MKNILVTGANGLLGHQVCQDCLQGKHKTLGLVRTLPHAPLSGVTYLSMNLNSNWKTEDLPDQIDAIIHLAQSPNFRDFPSSALDVFRVNIESTAKLLDYAKHAGVKHFILASSGGLYGTSGQAHIESSAILPPGKLDYYLTSKLASEMLAQNYSHIFQITILRFFFVYGPRQSQNMLIPRLLNNIQQGKKISLQGVDGLRINPINVADASAAVLATLETKESDIINVAGPDILPLREICEEMGSILGVSPKLDIQPGESTALIGDIQRMRKKLHDPKIRLTDSINELLQTYNRPKSGKIK